MGAPGRSSFRVLLVEDDVDLRATTELALAEQGYDVTSAASLDEALGHVDRATFWLILTDLFATSGADPLQSVEDLRARAQPTPIGVVTSWRLTAEEVAARGFAFLLPKPYELDELFARVASAATSQLPPERVWQEQAARSYFAALNRRDWQALASLCEPDVEYGPFEMPSFLPSLRQREAFTQHAAQALIRFEGMQFEDVAIYESPQGVAVRYTARWPGTDGSERQQSGVVFLGFKGQRVARISVRLNEDRLRALTRSRPLEGS
jgi:CheY-like chemotaxis protein/ketosteroid isomerase-like protein